MASNRNLKKYQKMARKKIAETQPIAAVPTVEANEANEPARPALDDLTGATKRLARAIEDAIDATRNLVDARTRQKLSIQRICGIGRELKELRKVLSIYTA